MEILKVTIVACLAVIALLPSGSEAQEDCTGLSEIVDVNVFALGNQLVVVWQEPANIQTCGFTNIQHTVTYSGHESSQAVDTSDYYAYFDYAPYRCVPGVITVTVYNDDYSTTTTLEYYTETSAVEDLTLTQDTDGILVAAWSTPADSEYCNFYYLVTYEDDNANTVTTETNDLQASLDSVRLSSCVVATVTVTPVNGNYVGVAVAAETEGSLNSVRNYALTEGTSEVIAHFDPPEGIELCEITYEVRENQQECNQKIVSVAAFNGRIYSPWVSEGIEVSIGSLSDVTASISGDNLLVSWTAPSDAAACGITYQVVYDGKTYTTEDASLTLFRTTVQPCVATTVSVSAVSSTGQVGAAAEVQIQGELGTIQNLVLEAADSTVTATWDAPTNSASCVLSYLLEYKNESGTHIYVTSSTSYSFEYVSCVDVTLSVSAYGEDGSESATTTFTLPAAC